MSGGSRLELLVDIFTQPAQRAQPLANLTVRQFIEAILTEFAEIEYLGTNSESYELQRVATGEVLDFNAPLQGQVQAGEHVRLEERDPPQPTGTWRPSHGIYLRERDERGARRVHRIGWVPAFVGRPASNDSDSLLAVNLQHSPTGMRVSRRHLRVFEHQGQYFIEMVSDNPTTLLRDGMPPYPLTPEHPTEIRAGDVIQFDRSGIYLRFLVRPRLEDVAVANAS